MLNGSFFQCTGFAFEMIYEAQAVRFWFQQEEWYFLPDDFILSAAEIVPP